MKRKKGRSRVGFTVDGEFAQREALLEDFFESLRGDIEYLREKSEEIGFPGDEKERIIIFEKRMERMEEELYSLNGEMLELLKDIVLGELIRRIISRRE